MKKMYLLKGKMEFIPSSMHCRWSARNPRLLLIIIGFQFVDSTLFGHDLMRCLFFGCCRNIFRPNRLTLEEIGPYHYAPFLFSFGYIMLISVHRGIN